MRKGIILAGGAGTRLHPLTLAVSKQLLPVYEKPMIYYPLSVLMLAGIREILIITTAEERDRFERLLGNGHQWGLQFAYSVQQKPEGIAQALLLAEPFLNGCPSALILGDNIFYGSSMGKLVREASLQPSGATIFAYRVQDPRRYGVVNFDAEGLPQAIEEKPHFPKSRYAVTGLYFYDSQAVEFARNLKPSARGELEISDINQHYIDKSAMTVKRLGRGMAWLDAGTYESLMEASLFIELVEKRQGIKVCCPEEIAFRLGFIDENQLGRLADAHAKTSYGTYLRELLEEAHFTGSMGKSIEGLL